MLEEDQEVPRGPRRAASAAVSLPPRELGPQAAEKRCSRGEASRGDAFLPKATLTRSRSPQKIQHETCLPMGGTRPHRCQPVGARPRPRGESKNFFRVQRKAIKTRLEKRRRPQHLQIDPLEPAAPRPPRRHQARDSVSTRGKLPWLGKGGWWWWWGVTLAGPGHGSAQRVPPPQSRRGARRQETDLSSWTTLFGKTQKPTTDRASQNFPPWASHGSCAERGAGLSPLGFVTQI